MNTEQFIKLYKSNPCRYQASALWKTLIKKDVKIDFADDSKGIKSIKIADKNNLYLYYDRDNTIPADINNYNIALLHNSQITEEYQNSEKYFRLVYDKNKPYVSKKNCVFEEVNVSRETKKVADFINRCYKNTNLSQSEIDKWTHYPVYDTSLWLWAKDKETKETMGLAIAEYDKETNEGSLEWVQLLPEHRGKGIAKAMICELINRLTNAEFITVSGKTENISAEKLYRNCGFIGNDVWYVVKNHVINN